MNDPQGMHALLHRYFDALRVLNFSARTLHSRRCHIDTFIRWAHERGLERPNEITKPILDRYQRYLYHYRKANGDPLSFRSQAAYLVSLRAWFRWLARTNHLLFNPAGEMELPKLGRRLPKHVLTASEAERILNLCPIGLPKGIRDRAILETLYSTGLRRMELINLRLYDVDSERGTVFVRQGKGQKDRIVPIGERALAWIERYVTEARPALTNSASPADIVFLSRLGLPYLPNAMSLLVKKYVDAANLGKKGSCHLWRHTAATLMLENGADIRIIQAFLGHANLSATEVYTQISIKQLQAIHAATHPAKAHRQEHD